MLKAFCLEMPCIYKNIDVSNTTIIINCKKNSVKIDLLQESGEIFTIHPVYLHKEIQVVIKK